MSNQKMTPEELEAHLRETFRREEPPAGFAERVIARAEASKRRPQAWWGLAAAAAVVAVLSPIAYQQFDGYLDGQREQKAEEAREQAEEARQQAMVALRITAEKLSLVRDKMQILAQRSEGDGE